MKRSRIKALGGEAIYHCMSRMVAEAPYWDARAMEVMRKQLWRTADFSGVQILTYCIMSNHIHILIRVPDAREIQVSDEELLRRYQVLYPKPTRFERVQIESLAAILEANGPRATALRKRLLARMHDVSAFMKTLKQRFTIWYNRNHDRHGTLWSERFKSVLIEDTPLAARTVAAYIDLNPVRAGLVQDPKNYRWCGYAEALAGKHEAKQGIAAVIGLVKAQAPCSTSSLPTSEKQFLSQALAGYRTLLFGKGAVPAPGKAQAASISPEHAEEVLRKGGKLPAHILLRCRVRYFTDGLILGTHAYVQAHLTERHRRHEIIRLLKPRPIPPSAWQDLTVAKGFNRQRQATNPQV